MVLEAVQVQAGHACIESTRIYLHLADDWLASQYRKAVEVIDAQVFAAPHTHRSTRSDGRADDPRFPEDPVNGPLLLPRENGKALDRHTVTRFINKAGATGGLGHIHPHQLRHTLATQAINRGVSLEAIAAMLGPPLHGHDAALRQDRQPHRGR